jgi:hypothetical protein
MISVSPMGWGAMEERMRKRLFWVMLLWVPWMAWSGPKASHKKAVTFEKKASQFGAPIGTGKKTTLGDLISNYGDYEGTPVVFDAKAKKVCEKSGCWMVLQDDEYEVRTLFKDYGFTVPKSILDKTVRVHGIIKRKKVSAATLRHYAKDAGKKLEEIKKIKTSEVQFEFEADGVEII